MNTNIALHKILNKIEAATCLFSKKGEIEAYNIALRKLWGLSVEVFEYKPNIIEFFEILRENRVYPELDNFREFCDNILIKIQSSIPSTFKQNLILPNGKIIAETQINSSDGLLFVWEDTTEVWNITHSLNQQKNIFNRILDKNQLPILIISSTGLVENFNAKFVEKFNLNTNILSNKPHIKDILEKITQDDDEKGLLLGNIVGGRDFIQSILIPNISIPDTSHIIISGIKLPNGDMYLSFNQHEPNFIAKNMDLTSVVDLHNNLIYDLDHIIGGSLTTIIGFSDLLKNEYLGNLNKRQKEYIEKILQKAELINKELEHKIFLSEFYNNNNETIEDVDINSVLSYMLHHSKYKLQTKNINIKLITDNLVGNIRANENLLQKAFSLLLMYLIDQINNNGELIIEITQNDLGTILIFRDTSKQPLLTDLEKDSRYDIKIILAILNKLNAIIETSYKNKSYRELNILIRKIKNS